jgi:hypothetical protein
VTKSDRTRGVVTERKLAIYLREHGFPHAERAVKTGVVTRDREVVDPGDITGTPGLVWQSKALRPLTRAENEVPAWLLETEQQRAGANADLGVLVLRRDQRPTEQWFAFVPLLDLYRLRGVELPEPLHSAMSRDRIVALTMPARLYLGDLVTLLRSCGYGEALHEPVSIEGTDGPVLMRATP